MTRTARRTIRTIRRSIRAAVQAGQKLVTAVRGAKFGVLVALYRAIDRETDMRIGYRDENGAETVRTITPRFLSISSKGHILVTGHDHLRDEKRTFRTDRITLATKEAPVIPAHPLRTATVGPYTITITALPAEQFGFAYGVDVWGPASEDDALYFEMPEGAPLRVDQAGAYDLKQAGLLVDEFADLYAA